MNQFQRALGLLEEPIAKGVNISFFKEGDKLFVDLDTKAKSHCWLELRDSGEIIAHRRYSRVDEVQDYDHLLRLIYECRHGREYFNWIWTDILRDNDFDCSGYW